MYKTEQTRNTSNQGRIAEMYWHNCSDKTLLLNVPLSLLTNTVFWQYQGIKYPYILISLEDWHSPLIHLYAINYLGKFIQKKKTQAV